MSRELGARLPRSPASHYLLLLGSDAQPPGASLPLGLPTPTSLKQLLLTCLQPELRHGQGQGLDRGSPQHLAVRHGGHRPCPMLAALGHIQWDKPLIHPMQAPGTTSASWHQGGPAPGVAHPLRIGARTLQKGEMPTSTSHSRAGVQPLHPAAGKKGNLTPRLEGKCMTRSEGRGQHPEGLPSS